MIMVCTGCSPSKGKERQVMDATKHKDATLNANYKDMAKAAKGFKEK